MSLVYTGVLSHAPGITGRAHMVENTDKRDEFYAALEAQRQDIMNAGAEAIIVIAAEHFANFFMNNMPAYCIGISENYEGPIEDPEWLAIEKTEIPGAPDLGKRITRHVMDSVDVAYSEEWKFDHGIMVPLNFLTPNYDLPVIPVNINYEKVLEGNSYLSELMGGKKRKERISDIFRVASDFRGFLGNGYLQFGDPIDLKDFLLFLSPRGGLVDQGLRKEILVLPWAFLIALRGQLRALAQPTPQYFLHMG